MSHTYDSQSDFDRAEQDKDRADIARERPLSASDAIEARIMAEAYAIADEKAWMVDTIPHVRALVELQRELVAAIAGYRQWYDTCTKTNPLNWINMAADASEALDAVLAKCAIYWDCDGGKP